MIRHIFCFLSLATVLAPITTSYSLYAAEPPSAKSSGMQNKTWGDKDSVNMPENGVTQKYGLVYGRDGDNKKTVQMAGNTNEKSDKGGRDCQNRRGYCSNTYQC